MWRFGCAFLFFILLVGSLIALVAWAVGQLLASGALALIVAVVLLLLVLAAVARVFRRASAPVGDLIEAAGRVEAGEIGTQVPERGPSEVRSLARAFNAMSSRLAANDEARRTLLADVSHELRTPLTVMQGTLEGVLDGVYPADEAHLRPVLDETQRPVAPDRRPAHALPLGGRRPAPPPRADRPRGAADGGRREPSCDGR